MKSCAVIVAAGKGTRMKSRVAKQYLIINEKPVLYYSIKAFSASSVDDIVIVCGKDDIDYVKAEIVDKYGFKKVCAVIAGGKERYDSVFAGLQAAGESDYVLIHDGARPLISAETIERGLSAAKKFDACVVGVPVKDTIKITDKTAVVQTTPDRSVMWQAQTPQCFKTQIIMQAYRQFFEKGGTCVTDDASVVELFGNTPVHMVESCGPNLKITTPEDILIAEAMLEEEYFI